MTCSPERRRAFTLLESLITVFLVMLVFGLVAELLIGAFRVTRFERNKSEATEAAQLALNRICCEVREAFKVEVNAAKNELTLTKFDASQTAAARFEANRYQHALTIRYHVDSNSTLLRDLQTSSTSDTHVVADGIQGARFEFVDDDVHQNLLTTLSVSIKGQLKFISSEVAPMAFYTP